MAASGRDLLEGQFSEGCGKHDRDGAEADADGSVGLVDVIDGESGDRGGPLGVEEQQQAGEAVFGLEGVVVQQASCGGPAGLVVHRLGGAGPSDGREAEAVGDLLCDGPADEVAGLPVKAGLAGHPAFKVGLSAGGQGQVLAASQFRRWTAAADVAERPGAGGGVLVADASAKPAQEVPGRVAVQDSGPRRSHGRRRGPSRPVRDGPSARRAGAGRRWRRGRCGGARRPCLRGVRRGRRG